MAKSPRRTISFVVTSLVPFAAAAVISVLAGRGTFASMMTFPLIFAVSLSGLLLLSLLLRRRTATRWTVAVVAATVAVAFSGVYAQNRYLENRRLRAEHAAMTALGGRQAQPLQWDRVFNFEPDSAEPLGDLTGAVTIVNFWATWCPPCRKELPMLEQFYRRHGAERVNLYAVTQLFRGPDDGSRYDDEIDANRAMIEEFDVSFPVLLSSSPENHTAYDVMSLPTTVLIDREGRIATYGIGLPGAEAVLRQAEELLAVTID